MENTAYIILLILVAIWIIFWIIGMFQNVWIGIAGLVVLVGFGLLFIKALIDRIKSSKNDKYSKDIKE
jgi:hypothetical protein